MTIRQVDGGLKLDKLATLCFRNGAWGMGHGEWGIGNGEWGMGEVMKNYSTSPSPIHLAALSSKKDNR